MVDQNPRPGQQAEYPFFDYFRDQYPVPGQTGDERLVIT